jgi:hypothetical protein
MAMLGGAAAGAAKAPSSGSNDGTATTLSTRPSSCGFDALPDELVLHIFFFLNSRSLLGAAASVCRRWRALCGDTREVFLDLTFLGTRAPLRRRPSAAAADAIGRLARRFRHVVAADLLGFGDDVVTVVAGSCPQLAEFRYTRGPAMGQPLTDEGLVALAKHCRLLTSVICSGVEITDASLIALAQRCPLLTSVDFGESIKVTDAGVSALAQHCPRLTSIGMAYAELTDLGVCSLAKHCSQLREVSFPGCAFLSDDSVIALANHCPLVCKLDLSDNHDITGDAVAFLATRCPGITDVDFSRCTSLTDEAVVALAKNCPHLRNADFDFCYSLTDASVETMASPNLFTITFEGCDGMTDDAVRTMARRCVNAISVTLPSGEV